MKKALIPLAKGFEDIEAIAIIDILRRGGVETITASLGYDTEVVSAHGIPIRADAPLEEVLGNAYDAIILPGGGEGTENLKTSEPLLERLRRQKEEGGLLCAICAAPSVLVAAGTVDGEAITYYPSCAAEIGIPSANVPAVADGQLVTGQGPGAAFFFALAVLSRLTDDENAFRVANAMLTSFG